MNKHPKVGPSHDPDFFKAIQEVFERYPKAAKKYSIRYPGKASESRKEGGCCDRQVAVSEDSDGQIVVKFSNRSENDPPELIPPELREGAWYPEEDPSLARFCCEWTSVGNRIVCTRICS